MVGVWIEVFLISFIVSLRRKKQTKEVRKK